MGKFFPQFIGYLSNTHFNFKNEGKKEGRAGKERRKEGRKEEDRKVKGVEEVIY